jgi:hypothetical protein
MGYSRFSTENANYELYYGLHIRTTKIDNFDTLDCTILESGSIKPDKEYIAILYHSQYDDIVKKHKETRKTHFSN